MRQFDDFSVVISLQYVSADNWATGRSQVCKEHASSTWCPGLSRDLWQLHLLGRSTVTIFFKKLVAAGPPDPPGPLDTDPPYPRLSVTGGVLGTYWEFVALTSAEVRQIVSHCRTWRLQYFGHLVRASPGEDYDRVDAAALQRSPAEWKRHHGQPVTSWLCTVENDLKPLKLGLNSASSWGC